jgi:NAD(P) transhydrogenase subunit alpha
MYASNLFNLVDHFWDKEKSAFNLNREDEIIAGALLTHEGEIVNETIKAKVG